MPAKALFSPLACFYCLHFFSVKEKQVCVFAFFVPEAAFDNLFPESSPGIVFAESFSADDVETVADEIEAYFVGRYGERSVFVSSSEQLLEQVNQLFSLVTIFLAGIAGISLLVGGIGMLQALTQ